jgi:hypothetical protein
MPYEPVGVWLIDQWRQIGLNVKQEVIEASAYHPLLKRGDFDVAMDFQCGFIVEPDLDLVRFLTTSDANYGKHADKVIAAREAPARRGGARHLHAAVASDHSAQREGEGLDDHAEPLSEQPARHRLAVRVISTT